MLLRLRTHLYHEGIYTILFNVQLAFVSYYIIQSLVTIVVKEWFLFFILNIKKTKIRTVCTISGNKPHTWYSV